MRSKTHRHRDRARHADHGQALAAAKSLLAVGIAVVAVTFVGSSVGAVVPSSTSSTTIAASVEHPADRVFTLTVGPTNPAVAGWPLMAGPTYELESDGTLYFRGASDADRLYPKVLVTALDDSTTARLVDLHRAVDIERVGGTTEYSSALSHPPVAIMVVGEGTAEDTFISYRIAERSGLSPSTAALVALIGALDAVASAINTGPLTSGRAIVVAEPVTATADDDPSTWPAPVEWSAMPPSIGDARCVVVEGDELAAALDAYRVPHGPQHTFDAGDGELVVTGIRMLMPSELGCPLPR